METSTDEAEELEDEPAGEADALGVGLDHHAGLGLARAGRHQRAGALDLDHADAADVDRRQVLEEAERGRLDPEPRAPRRGASPRPARATGRPSMVSSTVSRGAAAERPAPARAGPGTSEVGSVAGRSSTSPRRRGTWRGRTRRRSTRSGRGRRSRRRASPGRARGAARAPARASPAAGPAPRRARISSWRTVPTRQGTHWPHDSSRKNARDAAAAPARRSTRVVEDASPRPSRGVAPMARVPSKVSGTSSSSGVTKAPAAPPSSTACSAPAAAHAAGAARGAARRVMPNGTS